MPLPPHPHPHTPHTHTPPIPVEDKLSTAFYASPKHIWKVDSDKDANVAGYGRCTESPSFCYAVIKNAGHESPAFQPRTSYDLIMRFLEERTFDKAGDSPATLPKCANEGCSGVGPFGGSTLRNCAAEE